MNDWLSTARPHENFNQIGLSIFWLSQDRPLLDSFHSNSKIWSKDVHALNKATHLINDANKKYLRTLCLSK